MTQVMACTRYLMKSGGRASNRRGSRTKTIRRDFADLPELTCSRLLHTEVEGESVQVG